MGNSKNAGKTTVINAILSQIEYNNIAITSIGLDGEEIDQVTYLDKPRVYCSEGYIIATASETLSKFEAEYKILDKTNIYTSIGYIYIIEITKAGNALIAGPSVISEMEKLIKILEGYDLINIYIDGAFFRHSLAKVSEATILVIGANLSQDMDRVVKDAVSSVRKFNLKRPKKWLDFLRNEENVCFVNEHNTIKKLDIKSVVGNSAKVLSEDNENYRFLFLPLSLTNDFVERLIEERRVYKWDIIVNSPVSIQLNIDNISNLFKLKNKVYVFNPIKLMAVCYNPKSPKGYEFNNFEFRDKLEEYLGVKVINVKEGSVE